MSGSYRNVIRGLWLSSLGLLLVAAAVVMIASLTLYSGVHMARDGVHFFAVNSTVYNITSGCFWLIAVGLLLGFVGRCFCLTVPTAAKTAPARIWLAVVFEACSVLSGAAMYGASFVPLAVPSFVPTAWTLFILVTAYLARVQFLRFARALGEHANPSLLPDVTAVQRFYLYVPAGFFLAFGARIAGSLISRYTGDRLYEASGVLLAWLITTVAAVAGVTAVWRWAGMLAGLRKAVDEAEIAETQAAAANDPDREYRERYEQRAGQLLTK